MMDVQVRVLLLNYCMFSCLENMEGQGNEESNILNLSEQDTESQQCRTLSRIVQLMLFSSL